MSKFQVILKIRQLCATLHALFNVKTHSTLLFDILPSAKFVNSHLKSRISLCSRGPHDLIKDYFVITEFLTATKCYKHGEVT
jgi:hypothetical protein